MKRIKSFVVALAVSLLGPASAFAKCPEGRILKPVGNAQTGSAQISTASADVHWIQGSCTSTACVATLYDGDTQANGATTNNEFDNGTVRAEPGAAASGSFQMDLTESPLYFSDGVYFHDDANVQGIVVMACAPK